MDPVIRPGSSLLLMALQSAEDAPASPSALTDAVPCEIDSIDYNGPYTAEQTNEANGSFAAGAPMVVGQPATVTFRSRLKGAGPGVTYTASVKPPLHAALSACGFLGLFTAALVASALSAGTAMSATLGAGASAVAQTYRGMPLVLTGAPAVGRMPLITDYSATKVATLADQFGAALSTANTAAIPANWTYAPTTPLDAASRVSMHPCATIQLYEDGSLHTWTNCRGSVDLDGNSGKPGFGTFSFTGIYQGRTDAAMPAAVTYPGHSAPLLVQGSGSQPAFQVNRRGLAISKWSIKSNSPATSPDDPNTPIGYGAAQIADRMYQLEIDPLLTQVAVRNVLAEIAAFNQYPGSLQFGTVAGNRVSILHPVMQPTDTTPGKRDKLRAETIHYQAIVAGRDAANRDGDLVLCFS